MTTATINLDYNQIRNIVMQMPLQEKKRLFEELDDFPDVDVEEFEVKYKCPRCHYEWSD